MKGEVFMSETTTHRWPIVVIVISVLMVLETIPFLLAALLHLGIQFPLGFSEPRIIPAAIVEGLCGVILAVLVIVLVGLSTPSARAVLGRSHRVLQKGENIV
jgi:hypothetical protein